MKKSFFVLLSTLMLTFSSSFACECTGPGFYFGDLKDQARTSRPVVVLATVASKTVEGERNMATLTINKVLAGALNSQQVVISSGEGVDCGMDTNLLVEGDQYIMNLSATSEGKGYQVIECGVELLSVVREQGTSYVTGAIHKTEEELLRGKLGENYMDTLLSWEEEVNVKGQKLEEESEKKVLKLFEKHYGASWKEKYETYMIEEDVEMVKPFKAEYLAIREKAEAEVAQLVNQFQKKVANYLDKVELNAFIKEVETAFK